MIKRLRNKFILINMSIVTVMLIVIFSLVIFFMGMNMEMETWQLMEQVDEGFFHKDGRPGRRNEGRRPNLVVYMGSDGRVFFNNNGLLEELDEATALEYAQVVLAQENTDGILKADQMRYHVKHRSYGTVIVLLDISHEVATMKNLIKTCTAISALSFCVFLMISIFLAKWAVRPVEQAWNQQRQFVADASHELKTPLTVIMTNAELLQSSQYTDQERSRFLGSIQTMSLQMRGLVESLLELARVDNGTANLSFVELDFSELVSNGLLPFEPLYFEKALRLESQIEEGIRIKGSASHLLQVLEILLDNASKYSAANAVVTVKLKKQGSYCTLTVENPGEAIAAEDLKHIFKRFYRIDKARAMNHSYGLGLSIAESLVQEHGGKIWAESAEGVNSFFVKLSTI